MGRSSDVLCILFSPVTGDSKIQGIPCYGEEKHRGLNYTARPPLTSRGVPTPHPAFFSRCKIARKIYKNLAENAGRLRGVRQVHFGNRDHEPSGRPINF
jgi:hypothetical protein